jgi:hypothetical protein
MTHSICFKIIEKKVLNIGRGKVFTVSAVADAVSQITVVTV